MAVAKFVARNTTVLSYLAGAVVGIIAVTKAFTIAQAALNIILTANPVGIVVVAIGALVGLLVVAYTRSETFRKVVNFAFKAVADNAKTMSGVSLSRCSGSSSTRGSRWRGPSSTARRKHSAGCRVSAGS